MLKWFLDYERFAHEKSFDMARHSSIGCGGVAQIAFCPQSVAELTALLDKLRADNIKYHVLGNMTNVLPPDKGTENAIIRMKNLNGIIIKDGAFVYAGVTAATLLRTAKHCGKSGAEFLNGVPCTLGGALFMNAGAGGKYISEIVENVLVYRAGRTALIPVAQCDYAYKHSVFMENGDVIIGGTLRLQDADEKNIEEREAYYAQRRAHLPKGRSMGCVFKNPECGTAGDFIERSGLKGLRVGGAVLSTAHANFIINENNASASDIRSLITIIKNAVFAQYGVKLEEEIRYLD